MENTQIRNAVEGSNWATTRMSSSMRSKQLNRITAFSMATTHFSAFVIFKWGKKQLGLDLNSENEKKKGNKPVTQLKGNSPFINLTIIY